MQRLIKYYLPLPTVKQLITNFMIKPQLFGPIIFIIGLFFGFAETWYFGWNWLPINYINFACDALAMFLMSCGFLMSAISYINRLTAI